MNKGAVAAVALAALALAPLAARAEGNLAATPSTRIDLAITGAGHAVSTDVIDIETGKYYRLVITSDGGAEVLFTAPDLFNNVWLNQIVVAGAEIKLWGTGFKGLEVGEEGPNEVSITFVAIKPGDYEFFVTGDDGATGGTFHVH